MLSKQGFHKFQTKFGLISKLWLVQLVSLIGYYDEEGEMVLVYDYMSHGTLHDHLYKGNNPNLPWKRHLEICIGVAKGLHYLDKGANRASYIKDLTLHIFVHSFPQEDLDEFGYPFSSLYIHPLASFGVIPLEARQLWCLIRRDQQEGVHG
uniref:Serine-threonine/tyrosine-protein kinase catalytic domain-containing protein n=1 Tax=Lactuca sativa TaxID=4236 RepID=A0A9R1XG76_LACSA|nr:hypothetical protein LSAT_V11C400222520 [Lactuca sativa]